MSISSSKSRAQHWETFYRNSGETEVSWFEQQPDLSLELIQSVLPHGGSVVDVGGGASRLVDTLLRQGTFDVTVLDVSEVALQLARARLGSAAERAHWIAGDVTAASNIGPFDVWHDRAVFHFLTDPEDRRRYATLAAQSIRLGGYAILGTFAPDGPLKCSGLEVCRYDATGLAGELGPAFRQQAERRYQHTTPSGKLQNFCFAVFQRVSN